MNEWLREQSWHIVGLILAAVGALCAGTIKLVRWLVMREFKRLEESNAERDRKLAEHDEYLRKFERFQLTCVTHRDVDELRIGTQKNMDELRMSLMASMTLMHSELTRSMGSMQSDVRLLTDHLLDRR